ncbi:bifunctional DNA primase/polymerase [Streptomyces malaysiensis]|uniref:bifunctional DNA primase/polymerase n=1 Tax=Streptomyces malaysiensis TaxID=92644 RepID=UPI0032204EAB|nr:bifunctional DNA primase/polymerase [Streptomyces malaysiensis]
MPYDTEGNPFLPFAFNAAGRGWHVFPLLPGAKPPALHGTERCPHTGDCATGHRKWEQRATDDPEQIAAWWSRRWYNVAVATGPSGLVVIDLDVPKGNSSADTPCGVTTFKALCERAGQPVPDTYRVRTASGGWHLYFTAPPGIRLTNTAGKLGPLIDTRAWGGYVVAAGSAIGGGLYADSGVHVAPLPGWLCDRLTARPQPRGRVAVPSSSRASRYATAALEAEIAAVAGAEVGQRNHTLLRAARALGRLIASGDLTRSEVEEALNGAGERAGLRPYECGPVITSALNWSIAHNPQGRTA